MKIWIIKTGEPLPWLIDESHQRFWRAGKIACSLQKGGHDVTYITSAFDHSQKTFRPFETKTRYNVERNIDIIFLKSPGYKKNVSFARYLDHRVLAHSLRSVMEEQEVPDLILCSWPTIEQSFVAVEYGLKHRIPVVLDVRDCWPDIIYEQFPKSLNWLPSVLFPYEKMVEFSLNNAKAIMSVSQGMLSWAQHRGKRLSPKMQEDRFFYQTQDDCTGEETLFSFWDSKGVNLKSENLVRFVWAGSLEPTLDLDTCLRAVKAFSIKCDKKIEFVFCGRGSMDSRVEQLSQASRNVVFAGQVGEMELKSLLAKSHIGFMCYPNRFDFQLSIPNKLVDFCMAGMRIITNLNGELQQLVPESEVLPYKTGDYQSLASSLDHVMKNIEKYRHPSTITRLLFERHFDSRIVLPSICSYLEGVGDRQA
jgi:hypothetical protein